MQPQLPQGRPKLHSQEDHWIPLSDLMTGLMMIFMLVSIVFMLQLKRDEARIVKAQNRVKDVVLHYTDLRAELYQDLKLQFKDDIGKWHASITPDLRIRFQEPSVQFDTGSTVVKDSFKAILSSFFPRYVHILRSPKYRNAIEEIRIEGHTSSIWKGLTPEQAYYQNMQLSQERTRAVLMYVFGLPPVRKRATLKWLITHVTANGLSSSHLLYLPNGSENIIGSQRVEFSVRTSAEKQLKKILKALSK